MISAELAKYKGKKVLVTGHTGFKGAWLSIWLNHLGAEVIGYALDPNHENNVFNLSGISKEIKDYRGDIRNREYLKSVIESEKPEMVFHLAAQPLVIDSYTDPVYTYDVNIMGTAYLLEIIRESSFIESGVFITTDKVYKNQEWIWPYRETEPLGGYDPYSSSKAGAELIIDSYRSSFFHPSKHQSHGKSIASVRAGNVIGGGDWSANRLVPDCIKAIAAGKMIEIRNPRAVRPWQHVLEPLWGYLLLGIKMSEDKAAYCQSWNFGPESTNIVTVGKLVNKLIEIGKKGQWVDTSTPDAVHEASLLSLDINKAKTYLNWKPILDFEETLKYTLEWYNKYQEENVNRLCIKQIENYTKLCKSRSEN